MKRSLSFDERLVVRCYKNKERIESQAKSTISSRSIDVSWYGEKVVFTMDEV